LPLTSLLPPPRGGGSARGAIIYFGDEEANRKRDKPLERDNKSTPEQRMGTRLLWEYTDSLPSLGVGELIKPPMGNGIRPSAIWCEGPGITALSTAADDMQSIADTQSRVAAPIDHLMQSYTTEESRTITDETIVEAKRRTIYKQYGAGHAFEIFVHRDTLVWQSGDIFVMGNLVDGVVKNAEQVLGRMNGDRFEREMLTKKKPKPPIPLGRDVVAGPLVDGNVHCHTAVCVINSITFKARSSTHFHRRLAWNTREIELEMGLASGDGLATIRDRGLPTQRIEWTDFKAKSRERAEHRLAERATQILGEFDTPQTIAERLQVELREHLANIHERGEKPLMSNVHNIAAKYFVRIERDDEGALAFRQMRLPEKGMGDGEWVDSNGDRHIRHERWRETDDFLTVDLKMVAPSPADTRSNLTNHDMEKHVLAIDRRSWLNALGDTAMAEAEYEDVLRSDPGRVSRDIIARGDANFFADDMAAEINQHITDPDEVKGWVDRTLAADESLVVLSSITPSPLYTTRAQREMSEQYVAALEARILELDPRYDSALLDATIAEVEAEKRAEAPTAQKPFAYTTQQKKTFHDIAQHRLTIVQGDAASGKTASMIVLNRYYSDLGRKVCGLSAGQKAAEGLGIDAGLPAANITRAETLMTHKGVEMVARDSVVILEEVSTLPIEHGLRVTNLCAEQDATEIMIGDGAQQPNVRAGNGFGLAQHVAHKHSRLVKWTEVFAMTGERVKWMSGSLADFKHAENRGEHPERGWVAFGGRAIRTENAAEFERYLLEYISRGHIKFYQATYDDDGNLVRSARRNMLDGIAADVAKAYRAGIEVIIPCKARNEARIINAAVVSELGFDGRGKKFTFMAGERELSPGVRIVFKRNVERSQFRKEIDQDIHIVHRHSADLTDGVLNGYTGTVRSVDHLGGKRWSVTVALDNQNVVAFDPSVYRDVDFGYANTTMVLQGARSPIDIAPITRADDARSLHVAATRVSKIDLSLHTTEPAEELIRSLCSPEKMAPDRDAILFQRIVQQHGGEHTPWAKQVRKIQQDDNDPLCRIYRAEMADRLARQECEVADIIRAHPKGTRARERAIADVQRACAPESKVLWAWHRYQMVEDEWMRIDQRERALTIYHAFSNALDKRTNLGLEQLEIAWRYVWQREYGEAPPMSAESASTLGLETYEELIQMAKLQAAWRNIYLERYGAEPPYDVELAHLSDDARVVDVLQRACQEAGVPVPQRNWNVEREYVANRILAEERERGVDQALGRGR
jgi:hypothetical protein